jgi:DNA-binding response OmpR family regulator
MSGSRPQQQAAPFDGFETLVVEDETLIAFLLEDMLRALGCVAVRHAGAVRQALAALDERRPDVAILDVNLGGDPVFPLVERLERLGVPFVFATGYGSSGVLTRWRDRPVIQKPFSERELTAALTIALATQGRPAEDGPSDAVPFGPRNCK